MEVIILAAGKARRFEEFTGGIPKPLFRLNGESLLQKSLKNLSSLNLKSVSVVIGYKGNLIKENIGNEINGMEIIYKENKDFQTTGNMHSLFCALEQPEKCLVLDADTVYDPKIIPPLIDCDYKNALLLNHISKSGDEMFVVLDDQKRVIHFGKEHPPHPGFKYEHAGFTKYSKEFIEKMFETHEINLDNGQTDDDHEYYARRINHNFIPLHGLFLGPIQWTEIDRFEDIERAKKILNDIEATKI
jgi:choline kinase